VCQYFYANWQATQTKAFSGQFHEPLKTLRKSILPDVR